MRTTLTIDNDVLAAAKDLAAQQQKTVGKIISNLARKALSSQILHGRVQWRAVAADHRRCEASNVGTGKATAGRSAGVTPHS
ncbi:hypothetical protein [Inquilinus sp. Marseille-Q2685]|uniref:hypothetical protein n=1 Tax=Inquilinus sp. Marseille-Q2685 TaxID=2866581 RepID=UPI001CE3E6E0|nr:hypothetical protein [Inquilinus sp. Marseille-Q2685]